MDRGSWWATVHGVAKSRTQLKLLSTQKCNQLKNRLIRSFIPSGPLYEAVSLQIVKVKCLLVLRFGKGILTLVGARNFP